MGAPGRKILICGFGPFPGVPRNPAQTAARDLARLRRPLLEGMERHLEILPTHWDALHHLAGLLADVRPDAVLLLGVAGRRRVLNVEMRAVNAASGFPDAARRHAPARALQAGGPDALMTRANAARLVHAIRQAGLGAAVSRDAGRYLCNGAYYTALAALERMAPPVPVVFVHLPGRGPKPRGAGRVGAQAHRLRRTQGLAQLLKALMPRG